MCRDCPHWRAWFCGIKGDCSIMKAREDAKPAGQRYYGYGRRWTFGDDACCLGSLVPAA